MFLKKLLKNKIYLRLGIAFLMLVSTGLVYFVGFKPSYEFASTKVLEYKFQDQSLDEAEMIVSKIVKPVRVLKSETGKIVFYFQNITDSDLQEIDKKIGEKYQFILELKKYEEVPAIDKSSSYKFMNIIALSFAGVIVMSLVRKVGNVKITKSIGIFLVFFGALLFEFVLVFGIIVIAGFLGTKVSYSTIQIIILMALFSICFKFILSGQIFEKVKEKGNSLLEAWRQTLNLNKGFIVDSIILSSIGILPSIFLPFMIYNIVLLLIFFGIFILSNFIVVENLLNFRNEK